MNASSEIVYEERNSNVGLGEVIRFRLPPSINLLNTQETFLKFNIVVGVKGQQTGFVAGAESDVAHYYPWTFGEGGATNLIKNLTIKTQDGVIIEQITDYNILHRVLVNYTENSSEKNLSRLYEGADTEKVKEQNVLTQRTMSGGGASTAGGTQTNMEIEVCVPLKLSGILNNAQPYPNVVAPLEIEILLEDDAYKVIHAQGNQLGGEAANFEANKTAQNTVGGYNETTPYKISGTPNGAEVAVTILNSNSGGTNFYGGAINASQVADTPFFNGQSVIAVTSGGNLEFTVNSVDLNGTSVQLNMLAPGPTFVNVTANPDIYVVQTGSKPTITLSELQLVCGTITPTGKQLTAIESAVRTGKGYGYMYKSYMDFPVNMSSGALQVSNLINCKYRNCKAILSFWENVGGTTVVNTDNLLTQNDAAIVPTNYQYKLDSLLVPNRNVDLSRFTRTRSQVGAWSAVAIKELEQALGCCGFQVKDLSNMDGCLMFGRGLVPVNSGFTYDMSTNEESRVMIKFSTQTQSLLQHNYVCHMKELRISNQGKMVVE